MSAPRPKTCLSCGVEVIFARHEKSGKRMIFDPRPVDPSDGGAWLILAGVAKIVPAPYRDDTPLFRVHHASCPDAKRWKGRNRSDPPPSLPGMETS